MKNKNGFTLTEILVTIAMLAVLGTIIIYSTVGVTNSSKENQYNRMVENIKNSAKTYVSLYPDDFGDLFSSKAFSYISLNQLISAGLLDEDTVNPYTKDKINPNQECNADKITGDKVCLAYVKVYVDGDSLEMNYKYPLTHDDFGSQRWLQMSTLVSSTNSDGKLRPIYAYEGLENEGTKPNTNFGFAKEDGTLEGPTTISQSILAFYKEKYSLSYTMPSSFISCSKADDADTPQAVKDMCHSSDIPSTLPHDATLADYYVPTETGNFEIKYTWKFNGVNRSDTRSVRVISVSDEEKEKVSSGAKTTRQVISTTASADGLIYEYSGSFGGSDVVKTDVRFLQGDETGTVQPFTLYLEGITTSSTDSKDMFVDMKDDTYSGFDIAFDWTEVSGKSVRTILVRSYINGGVYKYASIQGITVDKPFRLIVMYDPAVNKRELKVSYIVNTTKSTEVKTTKFTVPSLQHDGVMFVGGKRDKTRLLNGTINKLAVYNRVDESLINRSIS